MIHVTTITDALKQTIIDNILLAVVPEIVCITDTRGTPPYSQNEESIVIYQPKLNRDPRNTSFADLKYDIMILVSTKTSDDRLQEIVDELRRIIGTYAVTGINHQYVSTEQDVSDRRAPIYMCELRIVLEENMASSTSSYSGTTGGGIDHGLLTGLLDDDHTQYLLANATRALTANWDVGAFTLTGLRFISDIAIGTAPFGCTSTTMTPNLNADMLDGAHYSTIASEIDTDISTHNVADNHIAHSGVSISAGTGMTGGGTIAASRTLNCSITQYTDVMVENVITAEIVGGQSIDNAIDSLISTHNVADNHIAHSGVSITAGTGMSGGGTIAATRTLNCSITQYTDALAKAACVSDAAYAAGWDTVTDVAPSKNAVYDKMSVLDGYLDQGVKTTSAPSFDHIHLTIADGTIPIAVTSTTMCTNLNSEHWGNYHTSAFVDGRLVRYNSTGTKLETGTVTEAAGALGGVTSLTMSGALSGLTTFSAGTGTFQTDANGYITTYPGMGAGTDNYILTYDNATGLIGLEVSASGADNLGNHTATEALKMNTWGITGCTTLSMNNQLTNTLAIGTAPMVITSTTKVSNLNVDYLDGYHADTLTDARLLRYESTGTLIQNSSVTETAGALGGITTIGMSGQLTSSLAIGTMPFAVTSTTKCTNLHADYVDSVHVAALTDARLLRYESTGTQIENATVTETAGALGGITTLSMSSSLTDGTYSATVAQLAALMQWGSANAAWTGCVFESWNLHASNVQIYNPNTNVAMSMPVTGNCTLQYQLPQPCIKNTLKMYISINGLEFYLLNADATNFVTTTRIWGVTAAGATTSLLNDTTDYTTVGLKTPSIAAAIDCSTYKSIFVQLITSNATASVLRINYVAMKTYYNT